MIKKLFRFGIVGCAAMITHWLIVMIVVELGVSPLIANVFGFFGAVHLSYLGHNFWTFATADRLDQSQSFQRFLIIACSSFVINEILYFILLTYTDLHYLVALGFTLILVSMSTFILSNRWAFKCDQ